MGACIGCQSMQSVPTIPFVIQLVWLSHVLFDSPAHLCTDQDLTAQMVTYECYNLTDTVMDQKFEHTYSFQGFALFFTIF